MKHQANNCKCLQKQAGEDLLAWQTYFHGQRNGVFLEMGALDGALLVLLS